MKKQRKNKKDKIKNNYDKKTLISIIILTVLFLIMIFTFSQNIALKIRRNKLNSYVEEYTKLKEEVDNLKEIKEKYEITLKNTEELENKKNNLQNKINDLNNQINNLNNKVNKLK